MKIKEIVTKYDKYMLVKGKEDLTLEDECIDRVIACVTSKEDAIEHLYRFKGFFRLNFLGNLETATSLKELNERLGNCRVIKIK